MTLQEWMTLKGLSDDDLAVLLHGETGEGISRSQINRIRRGKSNPRLKLARALERVTKIPAASFMLGEAGTQDDETRAAA